MRFVSFGPIAGLALSLFLAVPANAVPVTKVLDRVVAAVDGRAILLSEVRRRAVPLVIQEGIAALPADKRAAAEAELVKQLLARLIEERLIERDVDRLKITVSPEEIERRVTAMAKQNGMTVKDFVADASRRGLPERDLRDEVLRQIFDEKWVEIAVRPRVTPSTTLAAERAKRLDELRRDFEIEVMP